ncbi:nucleolar complex protein 2 homolog isoform X2 [Durio zibethinus]|uniref:Nucleolar complex protein 2 homolog isoform X2 n=1 Tax=Durio zibethinus TaxID=66656 RepID=A0A6P5YWE1_DURZI|nr:nucleolar complex protein 2 homolog isoform X2 [Durio zibethinus]
MGEKGKKCKAISKSQSAVKEHKEQLERLQKKDPEFYQYLQEHGKDLLTFDDEDIDDDVDMEDAETQLDHEIHQHDISEEEGKPSKTVLLAAMVDSWCNSIRQDGRLSAVRSLMKAFRTACHYGDDTGEDSSAKFTVMSSGVFNKIMLFALSEMDRILRKLLNLPASGGKKETINELMNTKQWKSYNHLVKSYLGNALHVLNQMTDTKMISFTLRRLQYSSVFLAAFPNLLRKYIKVALHFWGTGGGTLPVVSFLFLRDLCVRLGSDCLDECFRGVYKAYVLNCHFVNAVKLQHIQFLANCVIELIRVDLPTAYQHAFVFIRQLAMLLRDALNMKTKEAFRKVYEWKFINCLELWTGAICSYSSEADFKPLAYPLTQIISGVARLVPTARYFALRLRCVRMLNRIAASTGTFIPVSMLLLDMLEMKELNRPPTGGVGKAVDLRTTLKTSKPILKTRAFQEACVIAVVEELAEHLAQWSYSVAFFEFSFIPAVRLRSFCKSNKVERFRKEMRHLIRQDEKKMGTSPLSQYVVILRQRAQQRNDSMMESSVLVGEKSAVFGSKLDQVPGSDEEDDIRNEDGASVFSSSWFPGGDSRAKPPKEEEEEKNKKNKKNKNKKRMEQDEGVGEDEDIVEDLVLSSDEDASLSNSPSTGDDENEERLGIRQQSKKQKHKNLSKKSLRSHANKSKKRKRAH